MHALYVLVPVLCILAIAYRYYSAFIAARLLMLDDLRKTGAISEVEYQQAPFGIVGLETAIGLAVTELLGKNVLSLLQLVEKFSTNPRRILHLPDIVFAEGEHACMTLFDPSAEWVVDAATFASRSRNTPFTGRRLRGRAIGILNNGQVRWAETS